MTEDPLRVDLRDTELADEISLVADLMVVATAASGPLDVATVDEVLGVPPAPQPRPPERC